MHRYHQSKPAILLNSLLFFLVLFFYANLSFSQEFGGNPPSLKWRQINSGKARIIFPLGMESQAQRVANIAYYIGDSATSSIGENQKKINIVLQNQTVVSNGYVGLAPFRSEYYINPPQSGNLVSSNWLDVLAIHEQRHVHQFSNSRRGLTNFGYIISGELGWNYLSSLSIPNWFMEGDAVVFETALSKQGRGRIPSFYTGFKSLSYIDRYYSYDKVRNGSLKDFVPNHYESGYLMVNYGREEFGYDFWKEVLADAGKYKGLFYPFSQSIYRKSGNPSYDFYIMALRYYNSKWDGIVNKSDSVYIEQLNEVDKRETFTNYRYPYFDEEGNAIVYKSSYKRIGAFYKINNYGMEYLITRQGRVHDNYFSYKKGKLVWAEVGQDARWSWGVNSNIVIYDMNDGKKRRLTSSTKYFSPDVSFEGSKIVVFQSTPELKYNLHVLSSQDGSLLLEIPNELNYYISYPKWTMDDRSIIAVARDNFGRNALVKIDAESGYTDNLTEFTDHQLGVPWITKDYIYFSATFSGVDNIYALKIGEDSIYQVTDVMIGAYNPAINPKDGRLCYTDFTHLGSDLKIVPLDTANWKVISYKEPVDMPEYDFVSNGKEGGDITSNLSKVEYATEKYSIFSKLINLHSWSLLFNDPNYEWALRSNNILNTLGMNLGVRYNRNDQEFTYFFDAAYAQLYPVITFNANMVNRAGLKSIEENGVTVGTTRVEWWEYKYKIGLLLPFDISSGPYTRKFNLQSKYANTAVRFKENPDVITNDFNLNSVEGGFTFVNSRKKARQNIFAKNSQYINLSYKGSIDDNSAKQFYADTEWTFPGFSDNHNIVFQLSYQDEDAENDYNFSDNFVYARGYNRPVYDFIYKVGSNYHLPVLYPDWGLWGIVYLYRIRANVFFDYSRAHLVNSETNTESIQLYNSTGGEMVVDANVFNAFKMSFGFRYSYLLNDDPNPNSNEHSFEFFIPFMRF